MPETQKVENQVLPVSLYDVIRPGETRGLDFVDLKELRKKTEIMPDDVIKFALSELLCNALDKESTKIHVAVTVEDQFFAVSVSDDGNPKISLSGLKKVLDFDNKASSKRGIHQVSRGRLGNALKCIFGYSYALAEAKNLQPPVCTVESGPNKFVFGLKPDLVRKVIESEIDTTPRVDDELTTITVKFPKLDNIDTRILEATVSATGMVNLTRQTNYDILGKKGTIGCATRSKLERQKTSVLWYGRSEFETLFEEYRTALPDTELKDFVSMFRGFTAKRIIRENLQGLTVSNQ